MRTCHGFDFARVFEVRCLRFSAAPGSPLDFSATYNLYILLFVFAIVTMIDVSEKIDWNKLKFELCAHCALLAPGCCSTELLVTDYCTDYTPLHLQL